MQNISFDIVIQKQKQDFLFAFYGVKIQSSNEYQNQDIEIYLLDSGSIIY